MPEPQPSSSPATIELPAIMDIKAATPLHRRLLALRGEAVHLDASRVERIGGQCLQVLCGAVAAWRQDGKALCVDTPSRAFEDGLALLGFSLDSLTGRQVAP
ncbi:STAS domain-containing protein [Aureimonas psammosilenae]|uniref:STAS domain-containing protein n=1 Tax=Aureimonas psammosilenae TaxID=2495496 RepID=UPI0012612919|nr:STAS domain-containing protein [Aureimonas psammosilenae]